MSTEAQVAANQANAELSTGPKTEEGKAVSSRNHTSHGLTYKGVAFFLLPWENAEEYDWLVIDLKREYLPKSATETILVERMAQHHWLRNRAELLQTHAFDDDGGLDEKRLALFLRYQTTNERAFHKCLNDRKRQSNPSVQELELMVKLEDERRAGRAERTSAEPGRSRAGSWGIRSERAEPTGILLAAWTGAGDAGSVPEASGAVAGSIWQQPVGSRGVIRRERTGQRAGGGAVERSADRSEPRV
jgi:hypothetical protein